MCESSIIQQTHSLLPQIKDTYVSHSYTGNESHTSILFIHVSSVIQNLVVRQLLFLSEKQFISFEETDIQD
jgi:hypothetical protein